MTKLIAKMRDGYCNIAADSMTEREGMIFVYRGEKLVGVFDLGAVDAIYISGKEGDES